MASAKTTMENTAAMTSHRATLSHNRWLAAAVSPLVFGPLWILAQPIHFGPLGTFAGFALIAALVTGAITDIKYRRIYNWTTYTAFLWAIAINLVTAFPSPSATPVFDFEPAAIVGPSWLGGIGIWQCVAGAAVCFAITVVGYDLSGGGAGDVKIAAVIGALLGVHQGFYAVIYSYIIAAAAIICWAVWKHGPFGLLKAISRTLGAKLGPVWPFAPSDADAKILLTPVPLGPFFAIGTLLVALEVIPT
jgi:Flp pilus assembly protein protease CpaA